MGITLSADGKHARARVSWRGKQSGKSHGGGAHPGPSRLKLYTWFASKAGHLLELKMDACAPAICHLPGCDGGKRQGWQRCSLQGSRWVPLMQSVSTTGL